MEVDEKPSIYEGTQEKHLFVYLDTTSLGKFFAGQSAILSGIPVDLINFDYVGFNQTKYTNDSGWVFFDSLLNGYYIASVGIDYPFNNDLDTTRVTGQREFYIYQDTPIKDTLTVRVSGNPGLKINEIYYAGPPNNIFYFYDQYIELYNASPDTVYLDGMIVCRMGPCTIGADNVTYIFQFPGEPITGREYPVEPGQFVVLAQDAVNHVIIQGGNTLVNSIDLTHADWEFVNPQDYADTDNPNVPNIVDIQEGHRGDFMISLGSDIILIADGTDSYYPDGIDIETIIDVVEYSSISTHIKDITEELDAGWAGVGVIRYSGQSIERIEPGFDTDNSTIDFVKLDAPTPGYHHGHE
ncbi:MAG: DUF4876 domain-containing protein [Candidatus Marinimicrobia bacterium]|nr:DUF4876 domain-containing protein [Candidatus Neomarinimicrobiota bacterium]